MLKMGKLPIGVVSGLQTTKWKSGVKVQVLPCSWTVYVWELENQRDTVTKARETERPREAGREQRQWKTESTQTGRETQRLESGVESAISACG